MKRSIVILMTCLLFGSSVAQAAPSANAIEQRRAPVAVGEPIPIVEPDGSTIGTATVTAFDNPPSEANPAGTCCQSAFTYLTLSVTATTQAIKIDRLDLQGFDIFGIGAVQKMNNATDMAAGTIDVAVGSTVSIDVQFGIQSIGISNGGTTLVRVIWARSPESLITLVNLSSPVEMGSLQTLGGPTSDWAAPATYSTLALHEYKDPLAEVRESSAAPSGYRNVGIVFSVESFLGTSIGIEQLNFRLLTRNGLSFTATDDIVRLNSARNGIPQLESRITLKPGESYEGFLAFQLPVDAEITEVVFYLQFDDAFVVLYTVPKA